MNKIKCQGCKKPKPLVERSDFCEECYAVMRDRVHRAADRTRNKGGRTYADGQAETKRA